MSEPIAEGMSASESAAAGSTASPAVRLVGRGLPNRAVVRGARVESVPGTLLVSRDGRTLRTFTVGPQGDVVAAAHLGGPLLADIAPHSLGAVDLLDADEHRVARFDLRDWVPEADELTRSRDALERSGLVPLLEHAGLALRPVPASGLAAALDARPPSVAPWRGLPVAYTVLRTVAVVLAVGALLVSIFATPPDVLWWAASAGLLISTLAAGGLWLRAVVADRLPTNGVPELRPRPAGAASRRFRRTARLRAEPGEVVLLDGLGRERRLPRTGPFAVTSAAVVRDGTPNAQLELRTAAGVPRATLPWDHWFGGEGGREALDEWCAAAALPLERRAAPARRHRTEEEAARMIYAPPIREIVAASTWPHGLPGQAAVWQTAPFAFFLLLYSYAGSPAGVPWVLVATVLLTAGVQCARLLARRIWLDVPVRSS
ncbi:hypothetical protein [Blastococcus haudaquaticus]|uniref:Uncharacterized protein n=1 Tax=Blastococcus haudaquaticus TaxID=1938745 RepID=A0A286H101_9ACTN|nr:hypothetical protein [Blastococcus haudaquaticus]SOE01470.1 hypothetical protein SAMN06272739_3180 [Blastococcus haudaquaticus]